MKQHPANNANNDNADNCRHCLWQIMATCDPNQTMRCDVTWNDTADKQI